jgi:hypothetical protein
MKGDIAKIVYRDGTYVENPSFLNYNDGQGDLIGGGLVYSKDGILLGHCDPPGMKGVRGHVGITDQEKENMGKVANEGYVKRDDSKTATRLFDKNWSPLIVRKYQMNGWPLFIGIICDANLNDLDGVVYSLTDRVKEEFLDGSIQGVRNYCGYLNDKIVEYYNTIKRGCAEGVIVCYYVDKMFVSSAYGDSGAGWGAAIGGIAGLLAGM